MDFKDKVNFEGKEIILTNCTFPAKVNFTCEKFELKNCTFKAEAYIINNNSKSNQSQMESCTFNKDLQIYDYFFKYNIGMKRNKFEGKTIIYGKYLNLFQNTFDEIVKLLASDLITQNVKNKYLKETTFTAKRFQFDKDNKFQDLTIKTTYLDNEMDKAFYFTEREQEKLIKIEVSSIRTNIKLIPSQNIQFVDKNGETVEIKILEDKR